MSRNEKKTERTGWVTEGKEKKDKTRGLERK